MLQYTSQDRIEAYLQRSLTDSEASFIDDIIEMQSTQIATYTQRLWQSKDTTEEVVFETRFFNGGGNKELFLQYDFTDLQSVWILNPNGDPVLELDNPIHWMLYPLNQTTKESIRLRYFHFPETTYDNVAITAKWGSGSVPMVAVLAATALCANFLRRTQITSQFTQESIEGYSYKQATASDIQAEDMRVFSTLDTVKKITL